MHFPSPVPQVAWAIILRYQFPADSFLHKKNDIEADLSRLFLLELKQ
jgi:hypothetical protein